MHGILWTMYISNGDEEVIDYKGTVVSQEGLLNRMTALPFTSDLFNCVSQWNDFGGGERLHVVVLPALFF